MVHVQEELGKKDELVVKQQQTIEKQKSWISELQVRLYYGGIENERYL